MPQGSPDSSLSGSRNRPALSCPRGPLWPTASTVSSPASPTSPRPGQAAPKSRAPWRGAADCVSEGARGLAGGPANTSSPAGPTLRVMCRQPRAGVEATAWPAGLYTDAHRPAAAQLSPGEGHRHTHTTHTHSTVPITQAGSPGPHSPQFSGRRAPGFLLLLLYFCCCCCYCY